MVHPVTSEANMHDSNPFHQLHDTIDGLKRATSEADRRLFLRATVRGLYMVSKATTAALRALVAALP